MPAAFDISDTASYPELYKLLQETSFKLWQHEEDAITTEVFLERIAEAESAKRVAIFHNCEFADLGIANHSFDIPLVFSQCRFQGDFRSSHNEYIYKVFFYNVVFQKKAKFKSSFFFHGISFIDCQCNDEVSFERAKFFSSIIKYLKYEAYPKEIRLPQAFRGRSMVDFLGVTFHKQVSFANAHFGCSVLFSDFRGANTRCQGTVDFSCIAEEEEELVLGTDPNTHRTIIKTIALDTFHRLAMMGVVFEGAVTFENRICRKRSIFKNSVFHRAPEFHNAELHQDTDFRGVHFLDTYSEGAERAYRTLKLVMDKKRARREEGMFFALEQKSILLSPLKSYNCRAIDIVRSWINSFILFWVFSK